MELSTIIFHICEGVRVTQLSESSETLNEPIMDHLWKRIFQARDFEWIPHLCKKKFFKKYFNGYLLCYSVIIVGCIGQECCFLSAVDFNNISNIL